MRNLLPIFGLAAALVAAMVAPASAQRDPAYQAARQAGLVGEQPDGRWLTRGGDAPVRHPRCL